MKKTLETLAKAVGLFGLMFEIIRAVVSVIGLLDWEQFCGVLAVLITGIYGISRLRAHLTKTTTT